MGEDYARRERDNAFAAGDWYLAGQAEFGTATVYRIVTAPDWRGLPWDSIKVYASICRTFSDEVRRITPTIPFAHFQKVQGLPRDVALQLLAQAERENWRSNRMRIEVSKARHYQQPIGCEMIDDLATLIRDGRQFGVVLADPPRVSSSTAGKRGSAGTHYDTMTDAAIDALPVGQVGRPDSFLFLWSTMAGFPKSVETIERWGWEYRTGQCWNKERPGEGVGNYWRTDHELLLLGVRPQTPGHFIDRTLSSMLHHRLDHRRHSVKPPIHPMIERAARGSYLEIFGRSEISGWTVCGNALPPIAERGTP